MSSPSVRFLLDENLPNAVLRAIRQYNEDADAPMNVMRVGLPPAPTYGTQDPDLLVWAHRAGRLLVSLDVNTMPDHFRNHLSAGRPSAGVLIIIAPYRIPRLIAFLELIAFATHPQEWHDRIDYFNET